MKKTGRSAESRPALWVILGLFALALCVPSTHQYVFYGLATGASFALIALGYTMVYGIIELVNFAHGEIYMFGAYLALTFCLAGPKDFSAPDIVARGLDLLCVLFGLVMAAFLYDQLVTRRGHAVAVAVPVALGGGVGFGFLTLWLCLNPVSPLVAVVCAVVWASLLGVVMEVVAYRPLRRAPRLTALITALGLSLILQNLAQWIWSASFQPIPERLLPGWIRTTPVEESVLRATPFLEAVGTYGSGYLLGFQVSGIQVLILSVSLILMVALTLLVTRTRLGKAMRATAQDQDAAALMGVDVNGVISWTFAIGTALAAVAGVLVALYDGKIMPTMGYKAGVVAFSAAVLGGIGNLPGAVLGGLVLGVARAMSVWAELSAWEIGISYIVLIAIILVQPEGLLGAQRPRKS